MRDLKNRKVIWLKGGMFLALGLAAAALLLLEVQSLRLTLLWALSVWAFCRAYYFAFYVIEHYVDPGYRFSGLFNFVTYLCRRKPPGSGR
jgi:hypothetical protein